jgi:hypothetical protein
MTGKHALHHLPLRKLGYPADRDVQHDRELAKWMAESGDEDGGNVLGLQWERNIEL